MLGVAITQTTMALKPPYSEKNSLILAFHTYDIEKDEVILLRSR